jgi:hypothetical protein
MQQPHNRWRAWSIPTPPHAGILIIRQEQPALLPAELTRVVDAISQDDIPFTNRLFTWNRLDGWREEE